MVSGKEQDKPPLLVSVLEAARLLGVSESTVWKLIRQGKLGVNRSLGRRALVTYKDIEQVALTFREEARQWPEVP
jgi:excisionase family DNA binding protein